MKWICSILIFGFLLFVDFSAIAQENQARSAVIEEYKGVPCYLHFVKQGETIDGICRVYNISREELLSQNTFLQQGLKVDQVLRIPKKPESDIDTKTVVKPEKVKNERYYTVKKQETWYGISKQNNLTVEDLMKANPGVTVLQEGMELIIPKEGSKVEIAEQESPGSPKRTDAGNLIEVEVQQGQTAYSLSRQYGISIEQFYELNPGTSLGLKTDQVVRVPSLQKTEDVHSSQETDNTERKRTDKMPVARQDPPHLLNDTCRNRQNLSRTYDIALLLPFQLEEADSILAQDETSLRNTTDYKAYDFFQFYGGVLLAADSLEQSGFRARIHVFDADMEGDTLKIKKALRRIEMANMDLIIGPVFVKSFDIASRFALRQNIRIINPLSKRDRIIEKNPFVYKVQPSEESVGQGLGSFIKENLAGSNLILIRNDNKELSGLYTSFANSVKQLAGIKITEVNYAKQSFQGVTSAVDPARKNVIIFFTNNRSLIPNFVSMLNNFGKDKQLTLIGMPDWKDMGIETEFLANLDYHEVVPSFVDYESEEVKQFIKQFRNEFGTEPLLDKQAFLGFDIGWYFFNALLNYGTSFDECLPNLSIKGLQYNLAFSGKTGDSGFQNYSVRMLKLKDYQWIEEK